MNNVLSISTATGRLEFRRMYSIGVPKAEIAEAFGVCPKTIYKWARQFQLEKRKPGRKPGTMSAYGQGEDYGPMERINTCLNCTRPTCNGWCVKIGRPRLCKTYRVKV